MMSDTPRAFQRSASLSPDVFLACTVVVWFLENDRKRLGISLGSEGLGCAAWVQLEWPHVQPSRR